MHRVDRIRAFFARRSCRGVQQLLAAVVCWLLGTATVVAQSLQPSAATPAEPEPTVTPAAPAPATSPPCDCKLSPWQALEREEPSALKSAPPRKPQGDLAGSLGWEIAGGVIPAAVGVTLIYASLNTDSEGDTLQPNLALLSLGAVLTFFGPPTGVAIAGSATGGTGGVGYAFLGMLGGMFLSLPGMVIGSIVGYRLSADDEPTEAHASLTPIVTRYELGLQWSGAL